MPDPPGPRTNGSRSLNALLEPRSVAVIGASDDPSRIGGRPIRYMREAGFAGRIHPVNPKRPQVQGLPTYPDIGLVPGPVDLAVIAVPADRVETVLTACANQGVGSAVIFSAGFAETGRTGARAQDTLGNIARERGIRVLGPNCLGVYNTDTGLFATFSTTLEDRLPRPGNVGLVSQSGAYGSHLSLLASHRGLGIRYWITTGNECDITVPECIEWLAERDEISVVVAYAEGITEPDRLVRALERARLARKPVIFMKVGTTEVGARAARSHTASLSGEDAVFDAVLRQFGGLRARTTEEVLDFAYAASFGVWPASRRVALLTISGGVGVQMADAAVEAGLEVPPLNEPAQAELLRRLPFATPRNPVDITAQAFNDIALVGRNLDLVLDDGRYDSVVAFFTYVASAKAMVGPIRESLQTARRRHPGCLLVLSIVGPPAVVESYEAAGCPVFEDPTRAVRAVAALARVQEWFAKPAPLIDGPSSPVDALPPGPLSEHAAAEILARAGLPMQPSRLVATPDEAVRAASDLGFPVALKICGPDVLHKTELNGVALGLSDPETVRDAHGRLVAAVRAHQPPPTLDGFLVAPMADEGVDMVIGTVRDETFGPVVMVGSGGILVEVLEDVAFRRAPFDEHEARQMLEELRGFRRLTGIRGRPPADVDALVRALTALAAFAAGRDDLESAEINPLRVLPRGRGVVGLDALVLTRNVPATE